VNDYNDELKRAIAEMHGSVALWLGSEHVKEVFSGNTVWEHDVEVFCLSGHPRANVCFAWGVRRTDDTGWDVTAVLGTPPIKTARDAVNAAIGAYGKHQMPPK
jgi:hypothetical protein